MRVGYAVLWICFFYGTEASFSKEVGEAAPAGGGCDKVLEPLEPET